MIVIVIILLILLVITGLIFWKYQRQVKDICRQLDFLNRHESNMLITRELDFGGIGALADALNNLLEEKKKDKKQWLDKEAMISETYTNLSHDIRTPLTSLDGYFQLLSECGERGEQERYIHIIRERIKSLETMLDELFTFTRLKSDAFSMELSPCQPGRLLKEIVFSYYDEWLKLGITPEFQIDERPVKIWANEAALQRVIQNVIKNGLDHGHKQLQIRLKTEGKWMTLLFRNRVEHPENIDANMVFERFYKADAARSKSSTGLGLSIARELVLRMNGEIWAFVEEDWFAIRIRFKTICSRS